MNKNREPIYVQSKTKNHDKLKNAVVVLYGKMNKSGIMTDLYIIFSCASSLFFILSIGSGYYISACYFSIISVLLLNSLAMIKIEKKCQSSDEKSDNTELTDLSENGRKQNISQKEEADAKTISHNVRHQEHHENQEIKRKSRYEDIGQRYPAYRGYEHSYENLGNTDRAGNKIIWTEQEQQKCITTEQEKLQKANGNQ